MMTTTTKMLYARAGASAIAAALALSPIHAAIPKPIVDLSKSPAVSGKAPPAPPARQAPKAKSGIGPFDAQTLELGGGAILLILLGAGAFALSRRKSHEEEEWYEEPALAEPHHTDATMDRDEPAMAEPQHADERMHRNQPAGEATSAFAWGNSANHEEQQGSSRSEGESWVERAYRGPSPENPSLSLKARLKRAAFFDKREREAAAGKAAPVEADAGLPEAMTEERESETA